MSAPIERLVIAGASLAGLRAAQAARKAGFEGTLTVVGEEPQMPYTRPPLSKDLLVGTQQPEQATLRLMNVEADWRLGVPAARLDRAAHELTLADDSTIGYDRLIIATGCRARQWRGAGAELDGVRTLRTIDDSLALKDRLRPGAQLVIVGAGFIGCEVAASARKLGVEVTVVDIAPHPMLPLGAELGGRCAKLHEDHGVAIRCGVGIEAILGERSVRTVVLSDGAELAADVVLLALGAEANVEWLQGSGIEIRAGVECDATLTTTIDPDVLAAGDLAAWPQALAAGQPMRIEHWTVAAEHGQVAGRNALLAPEAREQHTTPPYFWSDQFDRKIQAVGLTVLAERLEIVDEDPEQGRLIATGERDGKLVAAVGFNNARRINEYRTQLQTATAEPAA
jgi:3-phenylpropionate/trans-cinnamate dioxygenase ferredoxin reductase component